MLCSQSTNSITIELTFEESILLRGFLDCHAHFIRLAHDVLGPCWWLKISKPNFQPLCLICNQRGLYDKTHQKLSLALLALSINACAPSDNNPSKEIGKQHVKYAKYVEVFRFEAEKWGFKWFINKWHLPCDLVEDGPAFVEEQQAYLVACKPNGHYLVRFDYDSKQWKLVK